MDEQLRGRREGVVDHVVEEGDVDSTGRDIGHHEKLRLHRVGQEVGGGGGREEVNIQLSSTCMSENGDQRN